MIAQPRSFVKQTWACEIFVTLIWYTGMRRRGTRPGGAVKLPLPSVQNNHGYPFCTFLSPSMSEPRPGLGSVFYITADVR